MRIKNFQIKSRVVVYSGKVCFFRNKVITIGYYPLHKVLTIGYYPLHKSSPIGYYPLHTFPQESSKPILHLWKAAFFLISSSPFHQIMLTKHFRRCFPLYVLYPHSGARIDLKNTAMSESGPQLLIINQVSCLENLFHFQNT